VYGIYFARCMNIFNSLLPQLVKYDVHTTRYFLSHIIIFMSVVWRSDTVVCMIITTPGTWSTRGKAVLNTWAKRCHFPVFFYSRSAAPVGHPITNATRTVPLDIPEGRNHLTGKTMAALRHSVETYGDIADWFLKCDDDT